MVTRMKVSIRVRSIPHKRKQCFYYTSVAITRNIPHSFIDALSEHATIGNNESSNAKISLSLAREQYKNYINELEKLIPNNVIKLPSLEEYPDCCFVEDTVVIINNKAIITRPGHITRQGEVDSIKSILLNNKEFYNFIENDNLIDMRQMSQTATCDGGDILYTGNHLYIGLSNRTNIDGAKILQNTFQNIPSIIVPPIIQGKDVLHLKSAITNMNDDTLLAPIGPIGDQILKDMRAIELGYNVIRLPDILSCNVVSCNGTIIAQADPKWTKSRQKLETEISKRNLDLVYVDLSELAKKDAALTCCSVLFDNT